MHHFTVSIGKGFEARRGFGVRRAIMATQLGQVGEVLPQGLPNVSIRQHAGERLKHFAITLTLILIDPLKGRIVQHAILEIATLHFQRGVDHRFATPRISQGGAVNMRGLGAERVQALPGLPCQHQQRQHDQHKGQRHQLAQGTGEKRESLQRYSLNH